MIETPSGAVPEGWYRNNWIKGLLHWAMQRRAAMQHGDLETWTGHRIVVVLEGVLATVTPQVETHRWRADKILGWDLTWHMTALKRIATMRRQYTDVLIEIVTFTTDEVLDQAAEYLNEIPLDVASIDLEDYRAFCNRLPLRADIQQVIDSDPDRLHNYGQLGRQVLMGGDF